MTDVMEKVELPAQFSDLAPFSHWAIESRADRFRARFERSMDDIRAFYDAMLPRADEIMAHLAQYQLEDLPQPERNLLNMMLSLVEISRCVELWNGNDMSYYTHPKEHLQIHL